MDIFIKKPSLDGITLEMIVKQMVEHIGWKAMGTDVPLRCFTHDPSVKSSLNFYEKHRGPERKLSDYI